MKITVLIPNYNNSEYIDECLRSILCQSYKDFNILIIDDSSNDSSVRIIKSYHDPRITLIQKEKNSGIIDTLNIGLDIISSEYIIRMDGDDRMHPERIEKLVKFMDQNLDFGVCGSGVQHFGISNDCIIYEGDFEKVKTKIIHAHSIAHASVIYRTSVLKNNSIKYSTGYNYIEDYKIFYDLLKVTKITSIPDILYFYRREDYNNFKNADIKKIGYLKVYSDILSELKLKNIKEACLIHFELFHNCDLSFTYIDYIRHIKKIIINNDLIKSFNKRQLKNILNEFEGKLFFRAVEQNKITLKHVLPIIILKPKKAYYYLKYRLNNSKC